MSARIRFENPLVERYAGEAMSRVFSPDTKFRTWRRLWIALAEAQRELGLPIQEAQLAELREHQDDIDYDAAAKYERDLRHDVMAHVHVYGDQCPGARGILHLGATSAYVGDNTDLILHRDALRLLRQAIVGVLRPLATFAERQAEEPALAYTHFQPAQLTTVGKRATLWLQDLLLDCEDLEHRIAQLRFRGVKGTTGTQASFLKLFDGDSQKVEQLDRLVAEKMGFERRFLVTGQTYTRKVDYQALSLLSSIAQSAHRFSNDIRLLSNKRVLSEPFEDKQIGSSAMAYKRNPMRSERIASLARFVMNLAPNAAQTFAQQWLERTLDDSANRRLSIPEAYIATDAVLTIYANVISGLRVFPARHAVEMADEIPFIATENILMEAVRAGGDRQDLHERIRQHSIAAVQKMQQGEPNDLVARLQEDPAFAAISSRLHESLDPKLYVGRAPEQVRDFLEQEVRPWLVRYEGIESEGTDLRV
ncbi:MAG: adenylosuccinate lyase [Planctomycetota bacterium]